VFRCQIFDRINIKGSTSESMDDNHRCCRPKGFGVQRFWVPGSAFRVLGSEF
jgi:hypothetical protein